MTTVWPLLIPSRSQNCEQVRKVHYPSEHLPTSRPNETDCPSCFSPPGTEHDSPRFLSQRGPRYYPPLPTNPDNDPSPTWPHKRSIPQLNQAWKPRASQRGGTAVHCGSSSSPVSSARLRPRRRDSRSQKSPRGRLAQSGHLTCSMDVTVSTESSCNRSRACSGLRLYSGSDQTGEEDGGQ